MKRIFRPTQNVTDSEINWEAMFPPQVYTQSREAIGRCGRILSDQMPIEFTALHAMKFDQHLLRRFLGAHQNVDHAIKIVEK